MTAVFAMLVVDGGTWVLHRQGEPAIIVRHEELARVLPKETRLVVALASTSCLTATFRTEGLPRSARAQALLYRFEESLPLSIEEVEARFRTDGSLVFGVAVERSLLDTLPSQAVAICPLALLAATDDASILVTETAAGVDIIYALRGKVISWDFTTVESVASTVRLNISALGVNPSHIYVRGTGAIVSALASAFPSVAVTELQTSEIEQALATASKITAGTVSMPMDFRPQGRAAGGQLRRSVVFMAVAAAITLVLLGAGLLIRTHRFELEAERYNRAEQAAFRVALPDQSLPPDPASRLSSEARRLSASTGAAAPLRPPASTLLATALSSMPTDVAYRLLDLRFESGFLTIEGQTRSHSDAAVVAEALRSRFGVAAPQTEQAADNIVSFTIAAAPKGGDK